MNKVITYMDTRGGTVSLTPRQIRRLEAAHKWPRNRYGEEYATVSHGLHSGGPSYSDAEIDALIAE